MESVLGVIVGFSTARMYQIGWVEGDKLDHTYAPAWYPNCDLSEKVAHCSVSNGTAPRAASPPEDEILVPIDNKQILAINKRVSVNYGYLLKSPDGHTEKIPIQEMGEILRVDSNDSRVTWCKISFLRQNGNEFWYSWQKVQDVQLAKRRRTRN